VINSSKTFVMSEKRKTASDDEGDGQGHAKRWAMFREKAGKDLKQRLNPVKVSKSKNIVNYIHTRLVDYDTKKKRYDPLEVKQCVELMAELEFDTIVEKVWDYYADKHGFSKGTHTLKISIGIKGPEVYNTAQLDGRKDLFVFFEKKLNECSKKSVVYASSSSSTVPYSSWNDNKRTVSKMPDNKGNLKSVFPKITPSAIHMAARIVRDECKIETGIVRRFIRNTAGWAWMPGFEIKFIKGALLSSGSFRDAYNVQILKYNELPETEYVLKQWNADATNVRKSELGCDLDNTVLDDLTRRSVQCQMVAKGLSEALAETVDESYGEKLSYIMCYLLETEDSIVSLEPKINGKFVKYFNNTMDTGLSDDTGLKAANLAHFSLEYSKGTILLTDLQGSGHTLTDPEIATADRYDKMDQSLNFGFGNYGIEALEKFKDNHVCNQYCMLSGLKPFQR